MINQSYDRALRRFILTEARLRLRMANQSVGIQAEHTLAAYRNGELDDTPALLCELVLAHNALSARETGKLIARSTKGDGFRTLLATYVTDVNVPSGVGDGSYGN